MSVFFLHFCSQWIIFKTSFSTQVTYTHVSLFCLPDSSSFIHSHLLSPSPSHFASVYSILTPPYTFASSCSSSCRLRLALCADSFTVFLLSYVPKTSGCLSNTLAKTRELILAPYPSSWERESERERRMRKGGREGGREGEVTGVRKQNIPQLLILWIGLMQELRGRQQTCACACDSVSARRRAWACGPT